jgi:hypothetical protein
MARITYEIGSRGSDIDTEDFMRTLRAYGDYRTGTWYEETVKSVERTVWLEASKTVDGFLSQLTAWCGQWSKRYPDIEVFMTLTEKYAGEEVRYASFQKGEFYLGETIITHSRYGEILDQCDCEKRSAFYEKRPTSTPFFDCPVRLNPPTAWAVENMMYANDSIGAR